MVRHFTLLSTKNMSYHLILTGENYTLWYFILHFSVPRMCYQVILTPENYTLRYFIYTSQYQEYVLSGNSDQGKTTLYGIAFYTSQYQ